MLVVIQTSFAQTNNLAGSQNQIDSLKKLLNKKMGKKQRIQTLQELGYVYNAKNEYKKALKVFFKTLGIGQSTPNKYGVAASCYGIGLAYHKLNDHLQAKKFYMKSLQFPGNVRNTALCYNNLGIIYYDKGSYSKAMECYLKSLKLMKQTDNKNVVASLYNNASYSSESSKRL